MFLAAPGGCRLWTVCGHTEHPTLRDTGGRSAETPQRQPTSACGIHAPLPGGSPFPVEGQQMAGPGMHGDWEGLRGPPACHVWPALADGKADKQRLDTPKQPALHGKPCLLLPFHGHRHGKDRPSLFQTSSPRDGHRFCLMMFSLLFPMHMCPYSLPYNIVTCSAN